MEENSLDTSGELLSFKRSLEACIPAGGNPNRVFDGEYVVTLVLPKIGFSGIASASPCDFALYANLKQPLIDLLFKKLLAFPSIIFQGSLLKRVRGEVTRLLTIQVLMKIKARALKRRVWFKVTSRLERGIVDLAIRCVERIRSPVLTRIVSEIVRKISRTLENGFLETVDKVGSAVAEEVCRIGEMWGNENASRWKCDSSFVRLLGINAVNSRDFVVCGGP